MFISSHGHAGLLDTLKSWIHWKVGYTEKLDISVGYTEKLDISVGYTVKLDISVGYTEKLDTLKCKM